MDILLKANKFHLTALKPLVFDKISNHFAAIEIREISKFEVETLKEILKNDNLCGNEDNIFERLVGWLDANPEQRAQYIPDLLKLIRLEHISAEVSCKSFGLSFQVYTDKWFSPIFSFW